MGIPVIKNALFQRKNLFIANLNYQRIKDLDLIT